MLEFVWNASSTSYNDIASPYLSVRAIYKNFFRNNFKSFPRLVHETKKKKKSKKKKKGKENHLYIYRFIDYNYTIYRNMISEM